MKRKFIIPSLVAAGLVPTSDNAAQAIVAGPNLQPINDVPLFKLFRLDHHYTLASHSSHASHASHASHRSSSGGTYLYTPPTYQTPLPDPNAPAVNPLVTLPGNSEKFKRIVMQVEMALSTYGYQTGPIDGVLDPTTRAALSRMQFDYNLKVTGTITPEVLDALKIVAQ